MTLEFEASAELTLWRFDFEGFLRVPVLAGGPR